MRQTVRRLLMVLTVFMMVSSVAVPLRAAIPASERAALIALYNAAHGDMWDDNSGWRPPSMGHLFSAVGTEGSWCGITVDDDHVIEIRLSNNGLIGTIPPEIENLKHLTHLQLDRNWLMGPILPELMNLSRLTHLQLEYNALTGPIPPGLASLSRLESLSLGNNNLSGSIPPELANLSRLENLNLGYNDLSGGIPPELANLVHLENLILSANDLSGGIPMELGNFQNLVSLSLDHNLLSGSIPPELGKLTRLEGLGLAYNDLSGSIPSKLGNLRSLIYLSLFVNRLSGSIPPKLGKLVNLRFLNCETNRLTGAIPPELGNLTQLESLDLERNQLTGGIPPELGNLGGLQTLALNGNRLSGPIPPELGNLTNLFELYIGFNRLSGPLPPELGNLVELRWFVISSNRLTGEAPSSLMNLTNILAGFTRLDYNGLYTHDEALRAFLRSKAGYWEGNQTVPPSDISAAVLSDTSVRLSWTPIPTSWEIRYGGYQVYYSLTSGGPWIYAGITADRASTSYDVTGLVPGTTYYFMIRTRTDADSYNENTVISDPSDEVSATTTGTQPAYALTVSSSPDSGALIKVSPVDIYGAGAGRTDFTRTYQYAAAVTLTAPTQCKKRHFSTWLIDGVEHAGRRVTVFMDGPHAAVAVYEETAKPAYTLTVLSSPDGGALITVSPPDSNGAADGATGFSRIFEKGTMVNLTAPDSLNGDVFSKWTVDEKAKTTRSIQVKMTADVTAEAVYEPSEPPGPPEILLGKKKLKFRAVEGGAVTGTQHIAVTSVGGVLNWNAAADVPWLLLTPSAGAGSGAIHVSVDHTGLTEGHYTGTVAVSDPEASNSPQTVTVQLKVYQSGASSPPFGEFTTPADGAVVDGSIAVTGWALDDIEMESVNIYRETNDGLVLIGSATFVEGARGDIERAYPDYPLCECGGWGYMMLTHLLPDGPHKLHAIARDKEGLETTLGVKTIAVDNSHAVEPFGVIDTPAPGETVSGSSYVNHGWVLTPQPNSIPRDGSTIDVYVDGAAAGKVSYNHYRPDVAEAFPGYADSDGAGGYFKLDTTALDNGVHTISWLVTDDAGNAGGIGSRYFTVQNAGSARRSGIRGKGSGVRKNVEISNLPVDDATPVGVVKGFNEDAAPVRYFPGSDGAVRIESNVLERLVIHLSGNGETAPLTPLPVGSTLDEERGVFYWRPGPGFMGEYHLVFACPAPGGGRVRKDVTVVIR